MDDLVQDHEDLEFELELLELELANLMRDLSQKDIFWSERVERLMREQRRLEALELSCGRIAKM